MNSQYVLPLYIALPLAAGFLIPLLAKISKKLSGPVALIATGLMLYLLKPLSGLGSVRYVMGGWAPPIGINLVLDGLSFLLLFIVTCISFLVVIYSLSYMRKYTSPHNFYSLLMLMIAGMNGVILSGDMFNLYVFLEIASISSYALVGFGVEKEELEAAFKYLVLGSVASSFILFGIALLYGRTGTLNMADMASRLQASGGMGKLEMLVAGMFLMGFGLKASMVPFHAWLPDAHPSAPAPISAMLSGLLIKVLGIYAIVRIFFNVFGMSAGVTPVLFNIFIALGLISMIVGALLAIGQWDFKRLLAYSSISQMGYVMLGFGIGNPLAIAGALFHVLNHAVFKSLLFLCSGSVEHATKTRQLKELGGLSGKMPLTSFSTAFGSLSISGVPPFGGFWSKLLIIIGAVAAGMYTIAAVTALVSFMTVVYYVKVQKYVLFGELPAKLKKIKEAPALMCSVLVVLALCCLGLGLFAGHILHSLIEPAEKVISDAGAYIDLVLTK